MNLGSLNGSIIALVKPYHTKYNDACVPGFNCLIRLIPNDNTNHPIKFVINSIKNNGNLYAPSIYIKSLSHGVNQNNDDSETAAPYISPLAKLPHLPIACPNNKLGITIDPIIL
jgi:hypothetical protein